MQSLNEVKSLRVKPPQLNRDSCAVLRGSFYVCMYTSGVCYALFVIITLVHLSLIPLH